MNLDTFHNHASTLPSGFKILTEEDLDRISRERRRAKRGRWAAIGGVGLLAFLGCLAGTGYASSVLTASSAPAKAPAPVHRVAKSRSPGQAARPAPGPATTVTAPPSQPAQQPAPAPASTFNPNTDAPTGVCPPAPNPCPEGDIDPNSPYGPYLIALMDAGITAPATWSEQTANNLEAAWAAGETEDQTNQQYLIPGGIYPYHLATFNAIVHEYFG